MRKFIAGLLALVLAVAPADAFWKGSGGSAPQRSQNLAGVQSNLELDNLANNYWLGANYYNSESAFLAASNGTKNGITYSFGGYVDPGAPQLLTNGGFSPDTTGWTPENSTISSVGGQLQLTAAAQSNPGAFQQISGIQGHAYLLTGSARNATMQAGTSVGIAANSTSLFLGQVLTTSTSLTPLSMAVGSDLADGFIKVYARAIGSSRTGNAFHATFSAKETLPFAGFTQGTYSGFVSGTTPASILATQVVATFGTDQTNNRTRIEYRTDHSLWLVANSYSGAGIANLNLGTVNLGSPFTVHLSATQNSIFGLLVGGFTQYDSSGNVPATGVIRYGFSPAGETWAGAITKAAVFGGVDLPANAMVTTGDSFMRGTPGDNNALNDHLVTVGRSGLFGGGGGWTIDQELADLLAMPAPYKDMVLGWWDGSANGLVTIAAYLNTMQQGIDSLNSGKFIVTPELKAPGLPANWQRADDLRDAMFAKWGATYVQDWRDVLTVDGNGAVQRQWLRFVVATAITAGEDCVIQSVGTTDFTTIGAPDNNVGTRFTATGPATGTGTITDYAEAHLNSNAMDLMAAAWSAKITANGWDNLYGAQLNWLLERDVDPASNDNSPMWLDKAA